VAKDIPHADWLDHLEARHGEHAALIRLAWADLAATANKDHALGAAQRLARMGFDSETLAAALLSHLPEERLNRDSLSKRYGPNLAALALGAAKLNHMDSLLSEVEGGQEETLRHMLLAMSDDLRVVIIKLAERTQTLHEIANKDPATQKKIALEARALYAPLANRLGVWQFKWELEDLACRYLEPDTYKAIARQLDAKRHDREHSINRIVQQLQTALSEAQLDPFEVAGRPKHIASILAKMRQKSLNFDELYDIRAVRVLVDDIKDCYLALGIVHSLWQPIPGQFDDYISRPKGNGYQSLHTAVIGPEDKAVEVQIRTRAMHHESELGVAAHWRYKEGGNNAHLQEKIAWVRQLLAWRQEIADSDALAHHFHHELFQDEVFALTPQGRVIALNQGATPLDFAYALHTDLGHRCRGAKVDGILVPLDTALKTGQRVEILTAQHGQPSRDWMNSSLGYLKTSRARNKVRLWFRLQEHDRMVEEGRELLLRELHRLGLGQIGLDKVAEKLKFTQQDDLYAALGRGELGIGQLERSLKAHFAPPPVKSLPSARKHNASGSILIAGEGGLLTQLARCCHPAPPDPIIGYTTQGRGVTIHRATCATLRHLSSERRARLLEAAWNTRDPKGAYNIDCELTVQADHDPLRDLSDLLNQEKIGVQKMQKIAAKDLSRLQLTLQVQDLAQLTRFLTRAAHLPGVISAHRK
jgi:GTP pyrophosphokinase